MMAAMLTNADLVSGTLDHPSYVQADGIYALEKELICDTLGTIKPEKVQEIRALLSELSSADSP